MKLFVFVFLTITAVAQYNESLGYIFGRLAVSSYCKPSQIESWTCQPCKKYPNIQFANVIRNSTNDTLAYIGIDNNLGATILVFRGVLPWDTHKWISDISFTKKKYPYCDNDCFVHQGFLDSYEDVGNAVLSIVRNYTALFKMPKLYVVGHSLGAAIATHAVAHLVSKGIKVDRFYSLGSPRVGDPKFHDWFNRAYKGGYTARITHNKDPVPHLPPESLGFEHLNYQVEYARTQVFYNKDCSYFKVCSQTGQDRTCSNQYALDLLNNDHLTYFNYDFSAEVVECQS